MTREEQIAVLQARLDDVNNSISQLDSALKASKDSDERAGLSAQISQLQQTAETLRTMLNNLATSADPLAMAASPAVAQRMLHAHTKAMAKSAKTFADQSEKRAQETLRLMVEPTSPKTGKTGPKQPVD